jgi:hypothetical protein
VGHRGLELEEIRNVVDEALWPVGDQEPHGRRADRGQRGCFARALQRYGRSRAAAVHGIRPLLIRCVIPRWFLRTP